MLEVAETTLPWLSIIEKWDVEFNSSLAFTDSFLLIFFLIT